MDFQKIVNTLGQEQNKSIKTKNFYVGEGILECENYFVPLDAITYVIINQKADLSIWCSVFLLIISLCFLIIPITFFRVTGFIMMVVEMLSIYLIIKKNQKKEYYLTINLNNNRVLNFVSGNKEFMQDIMNVMKKCINDRKGGYRIMIGEQKIIHLEDSSVGKVNAGGDIISSTFSTIGRDNVNIKAKGDNNSISDGQKLTEQEWMLLEKFFQQKMQKYTPDDKNYKVYNQILSTTYKRDEESFGDIMKKIGKKAIESVIVTGVGETTKGIILPILLKML